MGLHIEDPNPVVEQLARVFFFAFNRRQLYQLKKNLSSGIPVLCGRDIHWWWKSGAGCPIYLSLFASVPDGSCGELEDPGHLSFDLSLKMNECRHQHGVVSDMAKMLDIDYDRLVFMSNASMIERAVALAIDNFDDSDGKIIVP